MPKLFAQFARQAGRLGGLGRVITATTPLVSSGVVALFLLVGCDWSQPEPSRHFNGGLDLSAFDQGLSTWRTRPDEKSHVIAPRLGRHGDSVWMEVIATNDVPSRWRRKVRWPTDQYGVLTWTWSMNHAVDSAGFKRKRGPASAMALDVTLASAFGFHKTIRYVWSARTDRGAIYANRDNWHPKIVVLRDVRDVGGSAVAERVNVWSDFQRLWGFKPRHNALSIGFSAHEPSSSGSLQANLGPVTAHPSKDSIP